VLKLVLTSTCTHGDKLLKNLRKMNAEKLMSDINQNLTPHSHHGLKRGKQVSRSVRYCILINLNLKQCQAYFDPSDQLCKSTLDCSSTG